MFGTHGAVNGPPCRDGCLGQSGSVWLPIASAWKRALTVGIALLVAFATSVGACNRSPSLPQPDASSKPRDPVPVDTSRWLALNSVTYMNAPHAQLAGNTCLVKRGCPYEPVRPPVCSQPLSTLSVTEVHALVGAGEPPSRRILVRGHLALHRSGGLVACGRPNGVSHPLSSNDSGGGDHICCNHVRGLFVLRDPSNPSSPDLLLTSAGVATDIREALQFAAGCQGDDSALCCPLSQDASVIIEANVVALGKKLKPYENILTGVRLCEQSDLGTTTASDTTTTATSCVHGAFTYRDGTRLLHPLRCEACRCSSGAWQSVHAEACFALRSNEPGALAAAKRAIQKSVNGGLMGPYFLRPAASTAPSTVAAIREDLSRAVEDPEFLHEEPLPETTVHWPANCVLPEAVAEVWLFRGFAATE